MSYAELQAKMEEIQTKLFDENIEGMSLLIHILSDRLYGSSGALLKFNIILFILLTFQKENLKP